jgi:hypothetical protein
MITAPSRQDRRTELRVADATSPSPEIQKIKMEIRDSLHLFDEGMNHEATNKLLNVLEELSRF